MQTNETPQQVYSEISARIKALEALMGEDLKNEMTSLKQALKENTEACMLMMPEDIGLLVQSLRKVVGTAIQTSTAKASKTKTKEVKVGVGKKLSAAELAAALDDEDF